MKNLIIRPWTAPLWAALLIVLLALSCGKKSNPTEPETPSGPQPNPDGVLLGGAATDNAIGAMVTLPPSPADSADIDDRLFLTRLSGVISPAATVGGINAALTAHDVRIICMMPGVPFVTLKTPRLTDRAALDSLAAALTDSTTFLWVAAEYAPGVAVAPQAAIAPGGQASRNMFHLEAMRMPAAWNVKSLVASGQKTTVLVADEYLNLTRSSEITAQRFLTGGTANTGVSSGALVGNHGFHVSGILGADFDSSGATGACPDAQTHLSILSLPIGGWTFFDVSAGLVFELSQHLPASTFLLNTSLGYNDGTFAQIDKFDRARNMMVWRMLVDGSKHRFLHFTSAGNEGRVAGEGSEARWNSPFASATRFSTMQEMLQGVSLSPLQQAAIQAINTFAQQNKPGALAPLDNVIIVGAVNSSGQEAVFSSSDPDVSAVGTVVYGPCVQQDPGYTPLIPIQCDGQVAMYDGTSQATPQVAGLAAYLLNLRPSLTLAELKSIILRATNPLQEDAYRAVLSLDHSFTQATIRNRLFDVATSSGEGQDGKFDEHDLALFKQQFTFYETERAQSGSNDIDHSRFDLNGDGLTGGTTTGAFDLQIDDPPLYENSVAQDFDGIEEDFDENAVTDQQILCYYAWSELYTGSTVERASLLSDCAPPWVLDVDFPAQLNPLVGGNGSVWVWRDFGDSLVPQPGVQITLSPTGGTAAPAGGLTGSDGQFSTFLDLNNNALQMPVRVVAEYHGHAIADTTVVIQALVSNSGTLVLNRRIEKARSYACSNYGPNCNATQNPPDTSTAQGPLFDSQTWSDAGVWNGFTGSCSNTCTRSDTVTILPDSSLLTIGYTVTSLSHATATSPSADSGFMSANANGTVELEYQFSVRRAPVNLVADVEFNFLDPGSGGCCNISGYTYTFQVFKIGQVSPLLSFVFFTPNGIVTPKHLGIALPVADYSLKIFIQESAAGDIQGGTAELTTTLNATGQITVGTIPSTP